jgi:hypothetical protein
MFRRDRLVLLLDRTAVLFLGLLAGAIITLSFYAPTQGSVASVAPPVSTPVSGASFDTRMPVLQAASLGPNLAAAAASGRKVHVGVFGDSFGDGIWAALYRGLRADEGVEVHQFSERSTGFTRYRSLNVLNDIRSKIDRQPVDIAILSFGCNDTQGIYADGVGAPFMGDNWRRIVGERVGAVVALLRERGTTVYWVGLPRMREGDYDADIRAMNQFYVERMRALNVPFIDTAPASVDAAGNYAPYLPNPRTGERVIARANDGIHMTMNGYEFLVHELTEHLRRSISQARAQAERERGRHASGGGGQEAGSRG